MVSMVAGELGTASTEIERHLKKIETTPSKKAALLGTAIILRRVIGVSELT